MNIDLKDGIVPISAAASRLAKLIRQAQSTGKPIIVTQGDGAGATSSN